MTNGSLKSDITYAMNLFDAGLDGVTSAWKEAGRSFTPALGLAVLAPLAIGAAVGVLGATLDRKRRSGFNVALGGMVGSALGLGAGLAYASRDVTGSIARSAIRNVNVVRDAHWLEKNPIAYA